MGQFFATIYSKFDSQLQQDFYTSRDSTDAQSPKHQEL